MKLWKLLPEWKKVARWSWSFRLALIAALLSAVEVALMFWPASPSGLFAAGAGLVSLSAALARLLAQSQLSGREDATPAPDA